MDNEIDFWEFHLKGAYKLFIEEGAFCEKEATYEEYRDTIACQTPNGKWRFKIPVQEIWAYYDSLKSAHQSHAGSWSKASCSGSAHF